MRRLGVPERVLEMVRKEFLQIFRDPRLARVVFVAPILQLVIFGYAVSTDVREMRTFVVDHDRSAVSRGLVDAMTASGYFEVVGRSDRDADLVAALDAGTAIVGIGIPPGFSRGATGPEGASLRVLLDGTNSNTATMARGYLERIVARYGTTLSPPSLGGAVDLRERAWFNPDLASRNYNVPAVVGTILLLICLLLTSLSVVRERELGTLEQLMVSPLRPLELIAGKTIPFALIGLADMLVITAVALLWFDVPFRGQPLLFFLATLLYLLPGLGVGLLISTISSTQQEAFMSSFLVFMPSILLSGFMFPVSSMPELFQWITLLNPMRHYLVIVRCLFLKGSGLAVLWPQYLALLTMGTAVLGYATTRFRKTIA